MDTRGPKPDPTALSRFKPGDLYRQAWAPLHGKVSIYDGPQTYLRQLIEFSREQGLLMAAFWCMSEVCNGGFHQFFSNPTGVLAPEAVRGFEFLGMAEASRIVAKAMERMGIPYPRDEEKRIQILAGLRPAGEVPEDWGGPFQDLDQAFYKCSGSTKFASQADDFVRRNLELFFK